MNSPYHDEDESFNINSSSCLYLKFDKLEPATFETVKMKFTYGTQNGTEFAYYTFNVYKPFFHISLEEPFQTMEYGDYVVVDNFEVLNQCDFVWPWLPDTVSIFKEIIQGSEYCQLWNSYTDEFGTVFTGRDIYIVANGVKPTQDEEIIVRISTTDPDIGPINLLYIVKPVDLEISVTPSTISPGDTASIIIRKKYLDGTIEDFPEWQTFEIAKLEGCILGDILVDGELGPYFYNISQPIQFVTDSLAGSGTVKLKIGVPKFPSFASRPVVLKNTPPDQTESGKTDKEELQTPPAENPLSSCSSEEFESLLNNDCYLVVGDECDFENCNEDYDDIHIQLLRQYNNFEFREGDYITVCVCDNCTDDEYPTGQSSPVPFYDRMRKNNNGAWTNSWNMIVCKNDEDKIEVRTVAVDINFPIPIYVDFVADVCYNLISNFSDILINDTTELKDKNKIPDLELEDLVHDICGHYCYPNVLTADGYILKEVVETHELLHMSHYQKILNDTKIDSLVNELKKDLVYDCSFYQQYIKTPEGAAIDFEGKINQYIVKADRKYRKQSGVRYIDVFGNEHPQDPEKELRNELGIQQNEFLVDLIRSYHKALSKARGTDERPNCFTCP